MLRVYFACPEGAAVPLPGRRLGYPGRAPRFGAQARGPHRGPHRVPHPDSHRGPQQDPRRDPDSRGGAMAAGEPGDSRVERL